MNEKTIQNALHDRLVRTGHELICPNYTPAGWWEADLFAVTAAGYAVEYEIKITKADFLKDCDKAFRERRWRLDSPMKKKHEQLEARDTKGPSRFFFVTPKGLLAPEMIPPWAGWMEAEEIHGRVLAGVVKPAPQLHKVKLDPKIIEHCKSVFYYRYWNLRDKMWPHR